MARTQQRVQVRRAEQQRKDVSETTQPRREARPDDTAGRRLPRTVRFLRHVSAGFEAREREQHSQQSDRAHVRFARIYACRAGLHQQLLI